MSIKALKLNETIIARLSAMFRNKKDINKSIVIALIVFWSLVLVMAIANNKIAIDPQSNSCLPYRVFWLDYTKPQQVKKGDLLVFIPGALMHVPGLSESEQPFEREKVTKILLGTPGDEIKVTKDDLFVNNKSINELVPDLVGINVKQSYLHPKTLEKLGKQASDFERTFIVPDGHYFMVSTEERSFDGRYWGTLPQEKVIGKAYALF